MVTVPHIMVGLERMLDHRSRGVGLARFYCSRYIPREKDLLCIYVQVAIEFNVETVIYFYQNCRQVRDRKTF